MLHVHQKSTALRIMSKGCHGEKLQLPNGDLPQYAYKHKERQTEGIQDCWSGAHKALWDARDACDHPVGLHDLLLSSLHFEIILRWKTGLRT